MITTQISSNTHIWLCTKYYITIKTTKSYHFSMPCDAWDRRVSLHHLFINSNLTLHCGFLFQFRNLRNFFTIRQLSFLMKFQRIFSLMFSVMGSLELSNFNRTHILLNLLRNDTIILSSCIVTWASPYAFADNAWNTNIHMSRIKFSSRFFLSINKLSLLNLVERNTLIFRISI